MRSLLLVLKIVIAASLLTQPFESLASASKINSAKKGVRKNVSRDAGNLWERIRFGMQIPVFSALPPASAQTLPVNAGKLQKTKLIKTTLLPASTLSHNEMTRTKLNEPTSVDDKRKNKSRLSADIQKQIVDYVNDKSPSSASAVPATRIRTQIQFHPRTDKLDANAQAEKSETNAMIEKAVKRTPLIVKTVATITTQTINVKSGQATPADPAQIKDAHALANERINKQIAWYSQRPSYLQEVAERARPYLYHIVSGLSASHLPAELALLPIVESAYQPTAESPKSAAGLWQFMPSTGLDFDLAQSERYDGRLDIEASTQAAIRYLSFLKRHFNGDWLLALAAYNCGLGRVDDAISSNRANGLPTDYWSLHLPEETQDYVPRFLALSSIFANPKTYGLKLPAVKNEPYFVKVKVDRRFDIDYLSKKQLTVIAELANLSYEQFVQLNPGYLKPTLETDEPFTLLMPASNAKQLHQHLNYVEQFIAEPSISNAPLQQRAQADDAHNNLPMAVAASLPNKLPQFASPMLSLKLNTPQTTPRILTTFQPITLSALQSASTLL
ncbi:MAG: transglycosylase SLT domain-containing protein [Methylococcales bacterium]|nr:transglycosylase SLT domain-containing protein [Methylococcales bacterium]